MAIHRFISEVPCSYSTMVCARCHTKVTEGSFLVIHHNYQDSDRDFYEVVHRECSANIDAWNKVWKQHEEHLINREKANAFQLDIDKSNAILLIQSMTSIDIYRDGEETIIAGVIKEQE